MYCNKLILHSVSEVSCPSNVVTISPCLQAESVLHYIVFVFVSGANDPVCAQIVELVASGKVLTPGELKAACESI